MQSSKIMTLQNLLARQQQGSVIYDLTFLQIRSLQGENSQARLLLANSFLRHNSELLRSNYLFAKALAAAILVQDVSHASELMNRRFNTGIWFNVDFEDSSNVLAAIPVWEVVNADRSIFWFHRSILDIDPEVFDFIVTRWSYALPVFARYYQCPGRSTGRVAVNVGDSARVPGLAFCSNRCDTFLIPDAIFIESSGYQAMRRARDISPIGWHERQPVAYWRGGTSGHPVDRHRGWRTLPRITLCEIGNENRALLDAGITHIAQIPDVEDENAIRESGLMRPFVDPGEFRKYKYQVDIDGNTNSWPGLFQKLLTGSPVIKVTSRDNHKQWYYDRLRPWINFVPVHADMSDLIEKIEWLRCHDDVARQIGERGRDLADSLDFFEELTRAARTISAALSCSKGEPEIAIRFQSDGDQTVCLADGWARDQSDCAIALGYSSTIVIAKPIVSGDFIIELTVSPLLPTSQRVVVLANDEIIVQHDVRQRQVIQGRIPAATIARAESLLIRLLHPDGAQNASSSNPLDDRIVSIVLYEVNVTPIREYTPPRQTDNEQEAPLIGSKQGRCKTVGQSRPRATQQGAILDILYGHDIWQGFLPSRPREEIVQGWNGNHPALVSMLGAITSNIFIDVGSWKGQSTIFAANFMRNRNLDGCVISVDTFLGSFEHWQPGTELFSRDGGRPDLFNSFMDNVFYHSLADYVVPMPQTSTTAARILSRFGITAGIVHIDAAQDYTAVLADAEAFWPLIVPGGYLIGDDYHETWPGVVRAADEFAAKVGLSLVVDLPKWIVRKPLTD